MIHVRRADIGIFLACVAAMGVLLGLLDASVTFTNVASAVMATIGPFVLLRHRDESVDPPLDVLVWRIGVRGRKIPQLLASIDADNRR